jgi:hypothetical protein
MGKVHTRKRAPALSPKRHSLFAGSGVKTKTSRCRNDFSTDISHSRHAELVSASRLEAASRVEDWTLKQVQGDED